MISTTVRYPIAFAAPFLATLILSPIAARIATRFRLFDHPSPTKVHLIPTPYLGGGAVAGGFLLVGGSVAVQHRQLAAILLGALVLGLVGFIDDKQTVRKDIKLVAEIAAATLLWAANVRAGFFGNRLLDFALTVIWVVAVTNAVNFIDNLDSLSAGVAAIAAGTFFVIAAQRGDFLVASFALAIAGACLGFLPHNVHPARLFLGDAGTLMLGFLLASLALLLDVEGAGAVTRAAVPLLALSVPLFDMTLVVIARLRGGRRIYVGGTDHSSHRLMSRGWSPRVVAVVTYGAQLIGGLLAAWLLGQQEAAAIGVLLTGLVAAVVALNWLQRVDVLKRDARAAEPNPQRLNRDLGLRWKSR